MMWSIRWRFIASWLGVALIVWVPTGIARLFGLDFTLVGLAISILFGYAEIMRMSLPQFLRTVCPSLSRCWLEYFFHVFGFVATNMAIYLVLRSSSFSQQPVLDPLANLLYSKLGFFWLFLCIFLFCTCIRNSKTSFEPSSKKTIAKGIALLFLAYGIVALVVFIFAKSPLLGMTTTALCLCIFWKWDHFAKTSLTAKAHNKVIAGAMAVIILTGLISYKIAVDSNNTAILGRISLKKPGWKKAEDIRTVDEWARWYTSTVTDASDTIDQSISSYSQVEALCQSTPTDRVNEMICYGESDISFAINDRWKNKAIVKLLNADSPMANKIGLLSARKLAPVSEELRGLIMKVATKNPALAILAEKTLSLTIPENPQQSYLWITIRKKGL